MVFQYFQKKYQNVLLIAESTLESLQPASQPEVPFAYRIADLIGIDRRADKENKLFTNLKMGNIPSEAIRC